MAKAKRETELERRAARVRPDSAVGTVVGRNTRGGIDRLSNREARGEVPMGSTGQVGTSSFKAGSAYYTGTETSNVPGISKTGNTTGVTPSPKEDTATDVGVLSSEQGVTNLKEFQTGEKRLEGGMGTKESPLGKNQMDFLTAQGYTVGSKVPGRGILKAEGYFEQPMSAGTQQPELGQAGQEKTTTYINESGATETTTGAGSGSEEERKKMQERGYSISESTGPAEVTEDPEITKAQEEYAKLEKEITSYKNKLLDLIITDSDLKADIRGLSKAYDARIAEMRDITDRQVQSVKTLGIRLGAQYTGGFGGTWGGVISEAERAGLMKIAEIEGEKQSKIVEARAAARQNNYQIYAALMSDARSLATQKATALADLLKAQKEQDAKIAQRKQQIAIDTSISELYAGGTTRPEDILRALNQDEDGNYKPNVTAEEVDAALKVLFPPDEFKGMDSDLPTFEWLKANGRLPESMSFLQYKSMLANLKATGDGADKGTETERKINAKSQLSPFLQPYLPNGERPRIPGTQDESGQWQYFRGEDGNIGYAGLNYLLDNSYSFNLDRKDIIDMTSHLINQDHRNLADLQNYGFSVQESQYILNTEPPKPASYTPTTGTYYSPTKP